MSLTATDLYAKLQQIYKHDLKGLIFDCDGVLIDSKQANIGYYNLLLADLGRPPIALADEEFVQMCSAEQAADFMFTPAEQEILPAIMQKYPYNQLTLPTIELEPGVVDLLLWAKAKGLCLGVHTNRGSGMADVLQRFNLTNIFSQVMTIDKVEAKPSPQGCFKILEAWQLPPAQVLFLGDSFTDQEASKGAKIPFLAYQNPKLQAAIHADSFIILQQSLQLLVGH